MLAARGLPLIYVVSVFGVLGLFTILLRCLVRLRLLRQFGMDDLLMTIACFFYLIFSVVAVLGVHYGIGEHMSALNDYQRYHAMLCWWVAYLMYGIIITLCKISVGLFLLRVSVEPKQRFILWHAIHVTILAGVIFVFVVAFQCKPVSFFWTRFLDDEHHGTCIGIKAYVALGYWFSSICIVTDFIFGFMPLFMVRDLNLAMREKLVLVLVLSMAAFACFAPIVRLPYIATLRNPDYLYATTHIAVWSALEPGVAIVASCIATLRPLLRRPPSRHFSEENPYTSDISTGFTSNSGTPSSHEEMQSRWSFRETVLQALQLIGEKTFGRVMSSDRSGDGSTIMSSVMSSETKPNVSRGLNKSISSTPLAAESMSKSIEVE